MPKKKENEIRVVNIRLVKEPSLYSDKPINNPDDVLEAVAGELKEYDREVFAIINLRTNGKPINLNICSVGTLDSAMVSPREVFKSAILSNAKCIIAVHNHPSGTADPSPEDITTTERLAECGRILDIQRRNRCHDQHEKQRADPGRENVQKPGIQRTIRFSLAAPHCGADTFHDSEETSAGSILHFAEYRKEFYRT